MSNIVCKILYEENSEMLNKKTRAIVRLFVFFFFYSIFSDIKKEPLQIAFRSGRVEVGGR